MHIIYKKTQLTSNQFCRSSTCEQYIVQQNCRHNEKLLIIFSFFEIYFVNFMIRSFKIDASQKQYVNLNIHDLRINDLEDLYEQNMPFHFSFSLSFFF